MSAENDVQDGESGFSDDETEDHGYITVCKDCDYVDVVRAESDEELVEGGDDPAEHHFHETGHTAGSAPVEKFDGDVLSEMIFDE